MNSTWPVHCYSSCYRLEKLNLTLEIMPTLRVEVRLIWWKKACFYEFFLAIQIVLVYSVNFHIIMQHLNNIFLNFHCKISKIERVTANLRRRFEKKLFCGVHHNSQQNHLKQKKNIFVKGVVSRGNPGRIFFSFFQFFVALGSQKTDFR